MSDPGEIIAAAYAKEKRIRDLRANPRENRKEIEQLVASVRKEYRNVLIRTPGFTSDKVKDIIGNLWKTCFYKTIEEYRAAIRQLKKVLDSQMASMRSYSQQDKEQFALISKEFIRFLDDSMRFFSDLLTEVEKGAAKLEGQEKKDVYPHCVNIVYGCLLYLGDLARYKALHSDKPDEFTESMNYYGRAALTLPFAGNAHNQLAMLATYSKAESTAAFYYCRSILAKNPFSGGLQNLAKLFSINVETHRILQRDVRTDSSLRFKLFLSSFVRLCGLLFAWTIQMHADYLSILSARAEAAPAAARSSSPPASSSVAAVGLQEQTQLVHELQLVMQDSVLKSSKVIRVDEFNELVDYLSKELDFFLPSSKMNELRLLRLVATLIFFVHFAESPERLRQSTSSQTEESDPARAEAPSSLPSAHATNTALPWLLQPSSLEEKSPEAQLTPSEQQDVQQRTKVQSLALVALFKLVAKTGGKWNELQGAASSADKSKRSGIHSVLMMLSTFADWIGHHHVYLVAREPELSATGTGGSNGMGATSKTSPARTFPARTAASYLPSAVAPRLETELEEPEVNLPAVFTEGLGERPAVQPIHAQASASTSRSSPSRGMSEDMWIHLYRADRDDYRAEARARSMMKTALSLMKEAMENQLQATPFKSPDEVLESIDAGILLREHAELRGYLPVSQSCERLFKRIDAIHNSVVWIPEPISRLYRMCNLLVFIRGTLARSIGTRTAEETSLATGSAVTATPSAGRRGLLDISATTSTPEKDKKRDRKEKKTAKATEKKGGSGSGGAGGGGGGSEKKGKTLVPKRAASGGESMEVVEANALKEKERDSPPVLSEEAFPGLPTLSSVFKREASHPPPPAAKLMYSEVVESTRDASPSPRQTDNMYGLWTTAFADEGDGSTSLSLGLSMSHGLKQQAASTSLCAGFLDRAHWGSAILENDDLEGETLVEDLLEDEEVVFKPAFIRQLASTSSVLSASAMAASGGEASGAAFDTLASSSPSAAHPSSTPSMGASGSGGDLLGLYTPTREVADLLQSANSSKSDANLWASLGIFSSSAPTSTTTTSFSAADKDLSFPTSHDQLRPLTTRSEGSSSSLLWSDSLLDILGSARTSSLQEWGAPLLPTPESSGGGGGGLSHPPGLFGPSRGRLPSATMSGTETSSPTRASVAPPPGLEGVSAVRGPPKQAYLGMGGFQT